MDKRVRRDRSLPDLDGPTAPEGPYEEGAATVDRGSSLELLRTLDLVDQIHAESRRSLPLDTGLRELPIILHLIRNHLTGQLTTSSSLATASGLSYGTAIRAIDEMMRSGFIAKRPRTNTGKSFSLHPSAELLRRWQIYARNTRRLVDAAVGAEDGRGKPRPRRGAGRSESARIIPPPPVLEAKLTLPKGLRVLVHADPIFMAMDRLKRQFEMILGVGISSRALSIDRLRREIVANSEEAVSRYDLVACDLPWFGEMAESGRLLPLDGLIAQSALDLSDFIPDAVASSRYRGRQYGIPVMTTAEILVYRTDLFEEAGLSPPRTIADLVETARMLHAPEIGRSGIAWNGGRGTALGHTFMTIMAAHGQPIVNLARRTDGFDAETASGENLRPMFLSAAAFATAEVLLELLPVSPANILDMTWYDRARIYASGGAAMGYSHTLLANLFELDKQSPANGRTGYVPHPTALDGRPVVPLGGYALTIPANIAPERIADAWTALQALTSASATKLYLANGSLASPRFSVNRDPEIAAMSPIIGAVDEMARSGTMRMWPRPPTPEISSVIAIAGEEIHDMLQGLKRPADALATAQNRADSLMRAKGYY